MAERDDRRPRRLSHYCRPMMFMKYVRTLSADTKKVKMVHDMGMGAILNMKMDGVLDPNITRLVVNNFYPHKEALKIGEGTFINIRGRVKDFYNLPNGGSKLKHPADPFYKDLDYAKGTKFSWLVGKRHDRVWTKINTDKNMSPHKFCVYFMSEFCSLFLAPSTSQYVDTSFVRDLVEYQHIGDLDWCTFVADYLIAGISAYQDEKTDKVAGCLHLLHLIYADFVRIPDVEPPPSGYPRIKHITNDRLDCVANALKKDDYAKLMARNVALKTDHTEIINSSPQSIHESLSNTGANGMALVSPLDRVVDVIKTSQEANVTLMDYMKSHQKTREDNVPATAGTGMDNNAMLAGSLGCGRDDSVPTTPGAEQVDQYLVDGTLVNPQVEAERNNESRHLDCVSMPGAPSNCNVTTNSDDTHLVLLCITAEIITAMETPGSVPSPGREAIIGKPAASIAGTPSNGPVQGETVPEEYAISEDTGVRPPDAPLIPDNRDLCTAPAQKDIVPEQDASPPSSDPSPLAVPGVGSDQSGEATVADEESFEEKHVQPVTFVSITRTPSNATETSEEPIEGKIVRSTPAFFPPSDPSLPFAIPSEDNTVPVNGGRTFPAPPFAETVLKTKPVRHRCNENFSLGKSAHVKRPRLDVKVKEVYNEHVLVGTSNKKPKVIIGGASVTTEEFRSSLCPQGEATKGFMNVCTRAMSIDWAEQRSFTNLIIDQLTVEQIRNLSCESQKLDECLEKARIYCLERIIILLENNSHWVLATTNLATKVTSVHCPIFSQQDREKEHGDVVNTMVDSLKKSLLKAQSLYLKREEKTEPLLFPISEEDKFSLVYPHEDPNIVKGVGIGIYLLDFIEHHNGRSSVGAAVTADHLLVCKMVLAERLISHRWNLLNPAIVGRTELDKSSKGKRDATEEATDRTCKKPKSRKRKKDDNEGTNKQASRSTQKKLVKVL